jgi:chorismate dehydratase
MPTLGSVSYLNALPLLQGLEEATGSRIYFDSPAQLHDQVLSGNIEVALLPVITYLENPQLKLIPGTGIVSHGEVKSVKVFYERPGINLTNSQIIYLDPESKTSQRLLKLILFKKYGRDLNKIIFTDRKDEADSILQIGDKALQHCHFLNSTDLGTEWQEWIGLPFVYACWMTRGEVTQELLTQLHNAKMQGRELLEKIALRQQIVSPEEALEYLTQNIQYDIEGPEWVGLKAFFDGVVEMENQNYDTSLRFIA